MMSPLVISLSSIALMLVLIALRVPIGVALGGTAFLGLWYLRNFNVALSVLSDTPFVFAANWDLSAIPMFLLMGAIAGNSGIGTALFRAANAWMGRLPGGLAVATNWAAAGFGAASGSSIAAAAVMARLAIPEMLKHKYDRGLATGVVAAGGTLDALIPPSIVFVLYGIFAEVSVVTVLLEGELPGLLTACAQILADDGFALLTAHTTGLDGTVLADLARDAFSSAGKVSLNPLELTARSGARLDLGWAVRIDAG